MTSEEKQFRRFLKYLHDPVNHFLLKIQNFQNAMYKKHMEKNCHPKFLFSYIKISEIREKNAIEDQGVFIQKSNISGTL